MTLINFLGSLLLFLYIQFISIKLVLAILIFRVFCCFGEVLFGLFVFLTNDLLFLLAFLVCSNFVFLYPLSLLMYLFVLILNSFYLFFISLVWFSL